MKLVLFTPTDRRSAIGRVSAGLVDEWIAAGHSVIVVSTEEHVPEHVHDFAVAELVRWNTDGVVEAILGADVTVHQIGNSFSYHVGSLYWLQQVRGVVVLHDFYLTDLFLGWCWHTGTDEAEALARWYGPEAPAHMAAARASGQFLHDTAARTPMTEWLCSQALAVLTHSTWGLERVRSATLGPVSVARMPYPPSRGASDAEWPPAPGRLPGEFKLLSFGMINSNRRVPEVISAIAGSEVLRQRVTYHLVGAIRPGDAFEFARQARTAGVRLRIHGIADQQTLVDAVHAADAVVALRSPSTEAASATVLEAMQAERAVVVSDVGSSADLPNDVVVKLTSIEPDSIARALRGLIDDPDRRRQLGSAAREYVTVHHRFDQYARAIVAICSDALRFEAHTTALDGAVAQLAAWGIDDDSFDRYALAPIRDFWVDAQSRGERSAQP